MDEREFLIQKILERKKYEDISKKYGISRHQLTKWWNESKIKETVQRANQIFNSKKGKIEFKQFEDLGKRYFYEWYDKQPKKCYYCSITEEKLIKIFDLNNGVLKTKRKRGRFLELERKNSKKDENVYSPENCVLACYLCNNHKSDLITSDEHKEYFAKSIFKYLNDKYFQLNEKK